MHLMNKSVKSLLIALAAFGTAYASDSYNKTHYNTRVGRDTVPAFTTFHEMKSDKNDERFGGNVEATGFYARSTNPSHLAKNFGANGAETINVIAGTAANILQLNQNHPNVISTLLLHDQSNNGINALAGTLHFDPRQTVYGVRFDYFQRFDKWFDGLWASVAIPFLQVRNDLNMCVKACDHVPFSLGGDNVPLYKIFNGETIERAVDEDKHVALKCAKMCNNSKSGFGDIEAKLGWRFMEGSKYHLGVNATVVFPTGDKPDAQYLWAARTGEGKWGLGLGVDGSTILWEDKDQNLKLIGDLQYKYLFSGNENRTLGLKKLFYSDGANTQVINNPILSQYYLVGTKGSAGLQPLANFSTLKVKVEPGSQVDGTVAFAYNNGNLTLEAGYHLFWKEAERVSLSGVSKDPCGGCKSDCKSDCETCPAMCCGGVWKDDTYGVAAPDFLAASGTFAGANTLVGNAEKGYIKKCDLNTDQAETPSQLSHKIFGGLGYTAKNWEYPVMVGVGLAYEIPSNNKDTAEGYSFWAKAGVAF